MISLTTKSVKLLSTLPITHPLSITTFLSAISENWSIIYRTLSTICETSLWEYTLKHWVMTSHALSILCALINCIRLEVICSSCSSPISAQLAHTFFSCATSYLSSVFIFCCSGSYWGTSTCSVCNSCAITYASTEYIAENIVLMLSSL